MSELFVGANDVLFVINYNHRSYAAEDLMENYFGILDSHSIHSTNHALN